QMGVIVTTYNSPRWLEKVMWGYEHQSDPEFELIIADDGSGQETAEVIARFKQRGRLNIRHVWHEDDGFRKTVILNKAITETSCDYLAFTDGDCIPRSDYIANHKQSARSGHFVSGGLYRLTMPASEAIAEQPVVDGLAFQFSWLAQWGQPKDFKRTKLTAGPRLANWLNRLTPTGATWNGGNSSGWKADMVAVNGFDERMQYGGLDREMGERMMNRGVRGIQARYSVIMLHLDHKRGYENPDTWAKNNAIRQAVKSQRLTWTPYGIDKG
ncbi:MAG: glycosyltransferase family 2 protein, partial [Natronospirillum sp.]